MSLTTADAVAIAEDFVRGICERAGVAPGTYVVDHEYTREYAIGWVFIWNTPEFIRTRDVWLEMAGNAPFLVGRETGAVEILGTAHPIEWYLDRIGKGT